MDALCLGYHNIVAKADPSMTHGPLRYSLDHGDFVAHLSSIRKEGAARIQTIAGLRSWNREVPVFLTFDDGNIGAYEFGAVELERYGWRGHFFITTDWIGKPGFMDKWQIRELHRRGHVIGSHSRSHPKRMSALSTKELLDEWGESCATLSDIIGDPVVVASVADGYYSERVGLAAAARGIEVLFTSEPTPKATRAVRCLVLGRYAIDRWMPPSMSGAIAAGRRWPRWRQAALWEVKKFAKLVGGRHYLTIRESLMKRTQAA